MSAVEPLAGKKIVLTGVTGQIAFPLASYLAEQNEVYGVARYTAEGSRRRVESVGVRPVVCDLGNADFSEIPTDADYLLHLAAYMEPGSNYDEAIRQNAEATGLLLAHCRDATAALVMSTHSVYKPVADPMHVFKVTDPLGDVNAVHSPPYSVSKISQEAVARTCARLFDLPVTIARMNASYGPNGGLPTQNLAAIAEGRPIVTRWDPCTYQPIHQDDINAQTAGLLAAASVPATIVNWAGDEGVSVQEWGAYMGELLGKPAEVKAVEQPGTLRGSLADVEARLAAAGTCRVTWRDGLRNVAEALY